MVKVSVILATYNGEKYIKKQLESLLNQTYPAYQVLIGDDVSNDGTVKIVEEFIQENNLDGQWELIRNKKNVGHAANFISLAYLVQGDYVFFCDQDDIWMSDKIKRMVTIMEENGQINFLYANENNITKDEEINRGVERESAEEFVKVSRVDFSPENYFFKGLGCASCVRSVFLKRMLPFWTAGWEHDMFFWACAILLDSAYKYDSFVIWRRIHADNASISGKKTLEKRIIQVNESVVRPDKLSEIMDCYSIYDSDKRKFIKGYRKSLFRRQKALQNRNPFYLTLNVFNCSNYYLHKCKGLLLDVFLILFKQYPIK